jgi:hypothetical protein
VAAAPLRPTIAPERRKAATKRTDDACATCRRNHRRCDNFIGLGHNARPPLNAHLRTRGGHMRRQNAPPSDCRVYSWALLMVTDAKWSATLAQSGGPMLFRHPPLVDCFMYVGR